MAVWNVLSSQTSLVCEESLCYFMLVIYSRLQCSASCGQGYRQRLVSCSEVHVENDNYEYGHQSLSNCPGTPPESYMPCNLGPCLPPQDWRVGIWGVVSQTFLLLVFIRKMYEKRK